MVATTWLKQTLKLIMNNGVENGIDVGEYFPSLEMLTPEEIKVASIAIQKLGSL